jgi:putative transposase
VDQATKAGLLGLLEQAIEQGWTFRAACQVLELGEVRAFRWLGRRAADELQDHAPGGSPVHGLLADEVAEILALFEEWGETDRSHRKLAHRGSYLGRVWVSPSSVRRVLAEQGLRLRPLPGLGAASASHSPTGSATPKVDLDLRHHPPHPRGGRGDRDRGPGEP